MAAQICLKTDVSLSTRIIRETLSNKWTPAVFASRTLIGLNLTSCQIEISWKRARSMHDVACEFACAVRMRSSNWRERP